MKVRSRPLVYITMSSGKEMAEQLNTRFTGLHCGTDSDKASVCVCVFVCLFVWEGLLSLEGFTACFIWLIDH